MNPSVLIFVALAVAWLAYLIPKALEHTEVAERTRAVVDFSHRVRVLGRREPTAPSRRSAPAAQAAMEETAERPAVAPVPEAEPAASAESQPTFQPAERYLDRSSYNRAARRRRNVLTALVILLFVTAVLAVFTVVPLLVVAGPVVLLAGWLVACRLMVRRERPARSDLRTDSVAGADDGEPTGSITLTPPATGIEEDGRPAEAAHPTSAPDGWDPVEVPLPTYVAKPAAHRTVRTIDLDGTGVWSSGRNDSDSALAREADAADAARRSGPTQEERRRTS